MNHFFFSCYLSLELPRFVNQSNSLQVAVHYSTVTFICQIYGVPNPTVSWYKVIQQSKQTNDEENLQLLLVNNQQYVYSIFSVYLYLRKTFLCLPYSFTLTNVDDRSAGQYKCIGKNRLGSIQNEFQLFIRGMSK